MLLGIKYIIHIKVVAIDNADMDYIDDINFKKRKENTLTTLTTITTITTWFWSIKLIPPSL